MDSLQNPKAYLFEVHILGSTESRDNIGKGTLDLNKSRGKEDKPGDRERPEESQLPAMIHSKFDLHSKVIHICK